MPASFLEHLISPTHVHASNSHRRNAPSQLYKSVERSCSFFPLVVHLETQSRVISSLRRCCSYSSALRFILTPYHHLYIIMLFPNVPSVASLFSLLAATLIPNAQALATNTIANLTDRQPRVSYGVYIHHCYVPGVVALTFDDGPYIYTEELLDILAQYGAKATFFVNGHNLAGNEWLIQRVVNEGHQLASHTYVKHPNEQPRSLRSGVYFKTNLTSSYFPDGAIPILLFSAMTKSSTK